MSDAEQGGGTTNVRGETAAENERHETAADAARGLRELFVFRAGARRFALLREEVEAAAEDLRPAPLPFAPASVLGVVALRGRVRTALDPLKLMPAPADTPNRIAPINHANETSPASTQRPRLFVALAGDEQFALACDSAEESFTISTDELRPDPDPEAPARGLVTHEGRDITVLDPSRLFDAAMRGRDRRRRRT
jgi:chemotaxis signal transduction protein